MRYYLLLLTVLVIFTGCEKDNNVLNEPKVNEPEVIVPEAKEFQVLGWTQAGNNDNLVPALWTDGRQLSFLPTHINAHYKMSFSSRADGNWLYFGIEDIHSPSSSKAVMWQGITKTVLSEKTLHAVQQERINGFSVNPVSNEIYILAANEKDYYYDYYYYKVSKGGNAVSKTSINAGAHGMPVYIQANGSDVHLITVTQVYTDVNSEGKTIIKHLKNNVLYASYEIDLNEEIYLWNNLFVGTAAIVNDVCHLLAYADHSNDYYYLKLSKDAPIVQRPVQTDGYTPSFGAETGSIFSGSGVYENGQFYIAAKNGAGDVACLVIDVTPTIPTTNKVSLETAQTHTGYTALKTYKYGDDIYINGVADDYGVYWKNSKLIVPDKSGLNQSRIAHISYQ
ncbi:hypothetical protein [Desertivirga xinjiangensis]|uniref:hypothetical protein n=1 Tax=Desertivirga xinjiangensis TaxID=539206 RepID=UPI00210D6555|nr:hypothetical protein [Pedobacter xinjiangensis]